MKHIFKTTLFAFILSLCSMMNAQQNPNFTLHSNGVTCLCPNATNLETGDVNGVTYTKRTKEQITPQNAATTCTSGITDMSYLFWDTTLNQSIVSWDVSNVTNMQWMFHNSNFNQPIGIWDVGNVVNMEGVFYGTNFNQPIGNWNVSNVNNMSRMFDSSAFNQVIGNWAVSNVINMHGLFAASNFNQSITNWNVSNVTNMSLMFFNSPFNQQIGNWNVSNVSNMARMFESSNFNQTIGNWNVSNVSNMERMFSGSNFNQPISAWDVSNVNNMSWMFHNTANFNRPLGTWDVSNVVDMQGMFNQALNFNQPIGNWDVSNVTNMRLMFEGCSNFNQPIGNWDVSNVTNMEMMFHLVTNFNSPIGNWDVSSVTNMQFMFHHAVNFNQNIGGWDVSNVTNMRLMFENSGFNQPLGNWDVGNVSNMERMFNISQFNQPIGNWNVSSVNNMSNMFSSSNFNEPIENWDVSNVTNMNQLFQGSPFNQDISSWTFHPAVVFNSQQVWAFFITTSNYNSNYYDALLQSFSDQNLSNKNFRVQGLYYCNSVARNNLINNKGWTINGDLITPSSITSPDSITIIANQGTCEAIDVNLGIPVAQSCLEFEVENNAPEVFPIGTTQVTWTLTDETGQTISAQQNVTVTTATGETVYPTQISPPPSLTIIANQGTCEAIDVELGIPVAQSCLEFEVENNAPEVFPIGTTQVTWTLTDETGQTISAQQNVTVTLEVDDASLCFVSSDEEQTTKNRIFINNIDGGNVLQYEILRQVSGNNFSVIGSLSPGEVSFLDQNSNNLSQSYVYRIRTISVCETSSTDINSHQTILLQSNIAVNNSVNLSWNAYNGLNYDTYKVYRKINDNAFVLIGEVSNNILSFNDVTANVTTSTYEYYIGIDVPSCSVAEDRGMQPLSTTQIKSNILNTSALSAPIVDINAGVMIYPNPSTKELNIKINSNLQFIKVEIFNTLGQFIVSSKEQYLNIEALPSASYIVKIHTEEAVISKTFIKK